MLKPNYKDILIKAGEEGLHITSFLIDLELTFEQHQSLLDTNKKYKRAFEEYEKLCENYWFNMARNSMVENNGHGFNSRLWQIIMKNKFSERWNETNKVDLTSKGQQIESKEPIQIEIIKKTLES
jgi:hypothetical protein